MSYVVGISSGWWNIAKDPNLLGFGPKVGSFAATVGAQFNQVDIDTVLEFIEPNIVEYVNTIKEKMSMDVGLHGEIGQYVAFESAEKHIWDQAHERMIRTMVGASKIKFKYVNWHLSSSEILNKHERELKPFGTTYQVVSPEGTSFSEWVDSRINEPGAKLLRNYIFKQYLKYGQVINEIVNEKSDELDNLAENLKPDLIAPIQKNAESVLRDLNSVQEKMNELQQQIQNPNLTDEKKQMIAQEYQELEQRKNELDGRVKDYSELIRSISRVNDMGNLIAILNNVKESNDYTPEISDKILNKYNEEMHRIVKSTNFSKYILNDGEIDAYIYTGIYMIGNRDPLWEKIVGPKYMNSPSDSLKAYIEQPVKFNSAVAAKYLQAHFTIKDNRWNKSHINGISVVKFCEENEIKLLFECPQSGPGSEGLSRLFHPLHSYYLTKSMNSPAVMQCIDFEQEMGQGTELDKLFDDSYTDNLKTVPLPSDFGANVYLLHLGAPIPYFGTAHIPIALAERGSDSIYRWIYNLRIRGFKNGIIIFERGGGRGGGGQQSHFQIFEYAIYMLRQMVKYLDQDLHPKDLPPEFFGMDEKNKEIYSRQLIMIREHAWDPLEGLLKVPEEKHTFLGSSATESGKAQQWDRAKFR